MRARGLERSRGMLAMYQSCAQRRRAGPLQVQVWIEVAPTGIGAFNQVDLPGSPPALDRVLCAPRRVDRAERPHVDQQLHAVRSGKPRDQSLAMFENPRPRSAVTPT